MRRHFARRDAKIQRRSSAPAVEERARPAVIIRAVRNETKIKSDAMQCALWPGRSVKKKRDMISRNVPPP